jgi:hypothetical protein
MAAYRTIILPTLDILFCSWSALTSWPQDVVVNYKNKGLYKSLGIQNVADPGDTHHWRFYVSIYISVFAVLNFISSHLHLD